jgi:non-lysosomal glucosylceramidase
MGAGSIGRTYRGDFARWHLRVGGHTHRPALHTFTAVRINGVATVLSALPGHGTIDSVPGEDDLDDSGEGDGGGASSPGTGTASPGTASPGTTRRRRTLPLDGSGGVYRALYPRAWFQYDPAALLAASPSSPASSPSSNVRLSQVQFSPVLPKRYRESSLPVGVFRFVAQNDGDSALEMALMMSFQNPLASTDVAPLDTQPPRAAWRVAPQSLRHAPFTRRARIRTRDTSSSTSLHGGGGNCTGGARAARWTRVKGVHMYSAGVVNGTLTPTQPWHGGFAVAVDTGPVSGGGGGGTSGGCGDDSGGGSVARVCDGGSRGGGAPLHVTAVPAYNTGNGAEVSAVWDAFEAHGAFPTKDATEEDATEEHATGEDAAGADASPLAAAAVAVKFTLAPGERRSVRFAIAWDLPLAVFPRGPKFAKRYTRYHPRTRLVARGGAAPEMAAEALSRAAEWWGSAR